ncbi:Helix-turn-helix domain-containing protein [Raineyella antarctica]|uniref:Helix-turn-helix domain-containing protein n=1 Tax=Raineyella antarctica TaxID=1577474 RepID=A0A1G6GEJ7_9ACTN|nr:helix-turn-helix transcriptional regulator [Raineyella antarctica]SDB80428.1 Helix-turn-helix domain-containing protein [Raineyella antarctica]
MATNDDIRDFLTSRRGRITPDRAGLPAYGGNRRVSGLRREEVALLAGISVEYYTRLERGHVGTVSESVLEGLVRALQLDEDEAAHLADLLRTAGPGRPQRRRTTPRKVRPGVQLVLDSFTGPALVRNEHFDLLALNALGRALYAPVVDFAPKRPNTARFIFLSPEAPRFFLDWDRIADECVAALRAEAGRDPYDKDLSDLIGELSTRSETFRTRWAVHNVHTHRAGSKRFHHPEVGDLELSYESLRLVADEGQTMSIYTAEPGSPSARALDLLGSWAATPAAAKVE